MFDNIKIETSLQVKRFSYEAYYTVSVSSVKETFHVQNSLISPSKQ